jgi:hypothetical protein
MADRDLTLTYVGNGLYSISAPSEDASARIQSRFVVQFLSVRDEETQRGTFFPNAVAGGKLRTNAAIVTAATLAAVQVKSVEALYQPTSVYVSSTRVDEVSFVTSTSFNMKLSVRATQRASTTIEVTTTS